MFLYSASVTWFATHLTPCIINFASQLTRCVIIFASRFGLCILITVCNGPRGRLQLGGAGGRGWPALAPTGAAWCRRKAQGLQTGPGGAGTAAETCCHLLLLSSDPNLTPLPSSAPLQPCPSSFNCSRFVSHLPAVVGVPDTLPHMLYHALLVQPFAPPTTRTASPNSLFSFSWGGCFGRMPRKNYLT